LYFAFRLGWEVGMALSPTLRATLTTVAAERPHFTELSAELVRRLRREYGDDNLADRLMADIPPDWPTDDVADLFYLLHLWMSPPRARVVGASIAAMLKRWLREADDVRKLAVALRDMSFLIAAEKDGRDILVRVARRFPQFKRECERAIAVDRQLRQAMQGA
jgi:hypothetical protein